MQEGRLKIIELKPKENTDPIFIEVREVEGESGVVQAGGKISFDDMLQKIRPFCESIISNIQGLAVKPNSASAEFGLKVSAKGNLFIMEASGEATVKVTLNWNLT